MKESNQRTRIERDLDRLQRELKCFLDEREATKRAFRDIERELHGAMRQSELLGLIVEWEAAVGNAYNRAWGVQ